MTKRRRPATAAKDPNALVLHASVLALDPQVLHDQAEASVRALLKEGESANTVRSYASTLRYWAAWFRLRYRAALALPVPAPAVLQFLVDHVERTGPADGSPAGGNLVHDLPPAIDEALVAGGFKGACGAPALNTVLHRLAVLSKAHQLRDVLNPTRDPTVQELVRRIRLMLGRPGTKLRPVASEPANVLCHDDIESMPSGGSGHRLQHAYSSLRPSNTRQRSPLCCSGISKFPKHPSVDGIPCDRDRGGRRRLVFLAVKHQAAICNTTDVDTPVVLTAELGTLPESNTLHYPVIGPRTTGLGQ